jgi:hypothetical protein
MSKKALGLFEELARKQAPKLDRIGVSYITFDTENGQAKVKSAAELTEEKNLETKVKLYLSKNTGKVLTIKAVSDALGMGWQTAANEVRKFWRRGFLELIRDNKKVYYKVGKI